MIYLLVIIAILLVVFIALILTKSNESHKNNLKQPESLDDLKLVQSKLEKLESCDLENIKRRLEILEPKTSQNTSIPNSIWKWDILDEQKIHHLKYHGGPCKSPLKPKFTFPNYTNQVIFLPDGYYVSSIMTSIEFNNELDCRSTGKQLNRILNQSVVTLKGPQGELSLNPVGFIRQSNEKRFWFYYINEESTDKELPPCFVKTNCVTLNWEYTGNEVFTISFSIKTFKLRK